MQSIASPKVGQLKSLSRLGICVIVAVLLYQESLALIPWYFARDLGRKHPDLQRLPQPLSETTVVYLNGSIWEPFGCTVQFPWAKVQKDKVVKSVGMRTFSDGTNAIFFSSDFQGDWPREIRESAGDKKAVVEGVLGSENLASRFNLMRASMYTRPQDATLIGTRKSNARALILLSLKEMRLGAPIFEFHLGDFRGFQIGDPSQAPFKISLELFDAHDRQYRLLLSSDKSSTITQAEINAIIQSMHCS